MPGCNKETVYEFVAGTPKTCPVIASSPAPDEGESIMPQKLGLVAWDSCVIQRVTLNHALAWFGTAIVNAS